MTLTSSLQSNKCNSEALNILRALWNREEFFNWDFQVIEKRFESSKQFNTLNICERISITLLSITLWLMKLEKKEKRAYIEKWVISSKWNYEQFSVIVIRRHKFCVELKYNWKSENFEKENFFIIFKKLESESHAILIVLIKISDWLWSLSLNRWDWTYFTK